MEHDPHLVTTQESLGRIVDDVRRLHAGSAVALDTETTGFNIFTTDTLRGISIAWRRSDGGMENYYVPVTHPHSPNVDPAPLINALANTLALHVFHNATFDWKALSQVGYHPRWGEHAYYDTDTMAWLFNENHKSALKAQGALWFGEDEAAEQKALKEAMKGVPAKDFFALVRPGVRKGKVAIAREWSKEMAAASKKTWATLTADDIAPYGAHDTDLTLRLREHQLIRDFGETNPWPDAEREFRVREAAYRMEDIGVMIDRGYAEQLNDRYLTRIAEIEKEFDFNLGSTKQLGEFLYDRLLLPVSRRTKSGARSTDAEALAELEELSPAIPLLLEHRSLTKMTGTYIGPLTRFSDDDDRVHSSLNVTGTVTGRWSSSGPNMQNIPRSATDNEIKKLFRARDGYELFEVDLHSAELFVGASITNDTDMMAALADPTRDFHDETAIKIFGNTDGQNRTLAKNLNYGIPYGIGGAKFATYLVKGTGKRVGRRHIAVAKSIIARHQLAWPLTHAGIGRINRFAEEHFYIPLHVEGRYRHFRGGPFLIPAYTAFNAVVQGGVAEFVKDILLESEQPLAEIGAVFVLTVHDSFWLETPIGTGDLAQQIIQQVSDDINPFRIRMIWDAKRLGQ